MLGEHCEKCGTKKNVEIQHPEGCTWVQRNLNSKDRWFRYLKEYRAGTKLELLCRKCAPGKASKENREVKAATEKKPRKVKRRARTIVRVEGEDAVKEIVTKGARSRKLRWVVEVVSFKGHEVQKRIKCRDLEHAETVNGETHANLDGRKFFTRVISATPKRMRRALAA